MMGPTSASGEAWGPRAEGHFSLGSSERGLHVGLWTGLQPCLTIARNQEFHTGHWLKLKHPFVLSLEVIQGQNQLLGSNVERKVDGTS